jgi:DNA (cytosine-5)-methyltransferase 1
VTDSIPIIDLFAGAGGLGYGAIQAGGDLRLSVDNDTYSCETLRMNHRVHGGEVLESDVTALTGTSLRKCAGLRASDDLILVGGAPCQPFSKAAYWVDQGHEAAYRRARARGEQLTKPAETPSARPDGRRNLVQEFLRLVIEANANAFVFENVPSILHPRNRAVFERLRDDAQRAGYATETVVGLAADFGAAQTRQRVFLIGSQKATPASPARTHSELGLDGLQKWVSAGEALAPYQDGRYAEDTEQVTGRWAEHLRHVPPGMNYKFHTAWAGHPEPTFVAETRYWNFLLKLHPDRPSWTIPASPGPWTGPFHWSGRRLRIAELAALQSFPHGYHFAGPRREQVRQIGNAVPSVMGRAMVGAAIKSLASTQNEAA